MIDKILNLYNAWREGKLGGEFMPEDSNPNLPASSEDNYVYFTLPMALNYQRNSYKLWQAAKRTYEDEITKDVFDIQKIVSMSDDELRQKLTKYKLALQPNKHIEIWKKISETFALNFNGKIKQLFAAFDNDVIKIKEYIQKTNKKGFPYLSGDKICNYWLYVISKYTDCPLKNKSAITVAPDTHVIQATVKLGLITGNEKNLQQACTEAWETVLKNTNLSPIDMHTPLWLWSRSGFKFV